MSNINLTVEEINALKSTDIVSNDKVRDKFVQIYDTMWAASTGISGEAAYERESRNFNRLLCEKEDLRTKCTKFSIFTAFLDVAISGLSVEPGIRAQAYLLSRSVNIGKGQNGKKMYVTQCVLTVSGYGELVLRARCGQIRHADNPVIVYKEDAFEFGEQNGNKFVNYTCRLPHASNEIVAAFMKITRNDGSTDYAVLLPEDWKRLQGYSEKQNRKWDDNAHTYVNGKPNDLYVVDGGQIDKGFLIAKLIKHAFKTYPKARVGRGTQLESQQSDDMEITDDIYGVDGGEVVDKTTGEVIQTESNFGPTADNSPMTFTEWKASRLVDKATGEVIQTESNFGPAADTSAGVVVNLEETGGAGGIANDDTF